ncbi:MAG: hypothetical protein RL563_852 [Pseudomonadota bacterium]
MMSHEVFSMRILAIDDQADNLLLIRQALRKIGYQCIDTEVNPVHAIDRFKSESYDLVLLDYNMPDMNGLEVLCAISEIAERERIPIIMLTVQEDRQTRHASLALGCKDFISKPIDLNELRLRIGNQLENRSLNLMMRDQNILLEEKVSQRTEALQSLQLELIQRLADAAEYRDNETGVHVKRMSHFSQCIGRFFGLDEEHQSLLLKASPMHDIGKIGISDSILLKPGKYTPEEFEVMKQHTWIGARILGGSRFELIQAARDIALCHHERWNGEGYPRGLSGEDIPLLARIVSIADVFDALTMVRPYKTAWTTEAAYNEITTMSGSYFDPQVVEAFKAAFEEILQIRAVFSE